MIQKFRAWDTFHNEWVEHFYITENGLIYNMLQQHRDLIGAVPIEKSGLIVMQSTGLFDSSEPPKEIFEGDIVLFEDSCGNNEFSFFKTGVVEITQCRLNITNRYSVEIDDLLDGHHLDVTVIGNIHQHQHLLEELE